MDLTSFLLAARLKEPFRYLDLPCQLIVHPDDPSQPLALVMTPVTPDEWIDRFTPDEETTQ